jgi:flagellar motor switch protein FliM
MTGVQCHAVIEHMGVESMSDVMPALGENGAAVFLTAPGWEYQIMAHSSRSLILSCLDLVFGGDGSAGGEAASRPVSKTERRFATTVLNKLSATVSATLSTLIEGKLTSKIVIEEEDMEQLINRGQAAAVVQMRIDHRETLGYLTVAIPQVVLLGIRHTLTRESAAATQGVDSEWRRKLETELQSAKVTLTAILREKGFTLGDVANFSVGKLIPLQAPIKGRVILQSAEEPLYHCELGQADGHYSVRIESAVSKQETAIEEIASEFGELGESEPESLESAW